MLLSVTGRSRANVGWYFSHSGAIPAGFTVEMSWKHPLTESEASLLTWTTSTAANRLCWEKMAPERSQSTQNFPCLCLQPHCCISLLAFLLRQMHGSTCMTTAIIEACCGGGGGMLEVPRYKWQHQNVSTRGKRIKVHAGATSVPCDI